MLNKIELKGPSDVVLYGVVVWTDHKPAGSYLYKNRELAAQRYEALRGVVGPNQIVTLEKIDLIWTEVSP